MSAPYLRPVRIEPESRAARVKGLPATSIPPRATWTTTDDGTMPPAWL
jgi:hypothetical protein